MASWRNYHSASAYMRCWNRLRFVQPARRAKKLELHHVNAFIAKALEMDRLSLALSTAIQFDTVMRQKDVIGEWEPIRSASPQRAASCSEAADEKRQVVAMHALLYRVRM